MVPERDWLSQGVVFRARVPVVLCGGGVRGGERVESEESGWVRRGVEVCYDRMNECLGQVGFRDEVG